MLRSFHAELQKAHRRHDLLLCLLVPALIVDADGRGMHDRVTDTAVVRER